MLAQLVHATLQLLALGVVLGAIEWCYPNRPEQPRARPQLAPDLAFYFGQLVVWLGVELAGRAAAGGLLTIVIPAAAGSAKENVEVKPKRRAKAPAAFAELNDASFVAAADLLVLDLRGAPVIVTRHEVRGTLELGTSLDRFFATEVEGRALELLEITNGHLIRVAALPFHHRDPFDRLLIAQAAIEGLPIATSDPHFAPYGVAVAW